MIIIIKHKIISVHSNYKFIIFTRIILISDYRYCVCVAEYIKSLIKFKKIAIFPSILILEDIEKRNCKLS